MLNPYKLKYGITVPRLSGGWSSRDWQPLRRSRLFRKIYWYNFFWRKLKHDDICMMKKKALKKIKQVAFINTEIIGDKKDIHFHSCISKIDSSYIGPPLETFRLAEYYKMDKLYSSDTNPFGYSKSKIAIELLKSPSNRAATNIGYSSKTKTWWGWSHRAISKFRIGDKIKYDDDLLILSTGWLPGAPWYKKEEEEINRIKSMFKDGVLTITDDKTAWLLAKRFASSVALGIISATTPPLYCIF